MTKYDIKNYLEKIYNVPVANVKTVNKLGKTRKNDFADYLIKDDDQKVAFVTLPPGKLFYQEILGLDSLSGHKFEWPDLKITEGQDKQKSGAEV